MTVLRNEWFVLQRLRGSATRLTTQTQEGDISAHADAIFNLPPSKYLRPKKAGKVNLFKETPNKRVPLLSA